MWGQAAAEAMEAAAKAATDAGMTIFAAAGDNDSSDGAQSPANVDLPSSCPHVVACGGTRKTATTESVWNDDPGNTSGAGTGGGYSRFFPAQPFQIDAPSPPANWPYGRGRMVPDLAANAAPATGYQVFLRGKPDLGGGTSAVAPLLAGLFAAFGRKLGFVSPLLWENRWAFTDITSGSNGMFHAISGPDPCSGLGTPIGERLADLFLGPSDALPLDSAGWD